MHQTESFRPHPWRAVITAFVAGLTLTACSTTTAVDDARPDARDSNESGAAVVPVVPEADCPTVEPDLTTITGADFDETGLRINVRTTTWCDEHRFVVHSCGSTEETTTYRVSENNDCGMPNDGVIEHVLVIAREHLGESARVESFDDQSVRITR